MKRWHWAVLIATQAAILGGWAWASRSRCQPRVKLDVLADGKPPWMWGRSPASYRLHVIGPDLDAEVRFDSPFQTVTGSDRLSAWQHMRGVVAFELQDPPPHFKLVLEVDGARLIERVLTFQQDRPCYRQSLHVDLPPSAIALVEASKQASDPSPH